MQRANSVKAWQRASLTQPQRLTGKTSYALIQRGQRVAGYDNYKFWHYHPLGEMARHVTCTEPTPGEAIAELALASAKLGIIL